MSRKTAAGVLIVTALSTALASQSARPAVAFTFQIGDYGDQGVVIAVDAQGNSYVAGSRYTASNPFPITENAAQKTRAAMFIAKVDARGERLVWATYLGGTRNRNWYWRGPLDYPTGITTDPEGNVFVIGWTAAVDFPVENAAVSVGQPTGSESFLTKISADGSRLLYSTYLGGGSATSIATDFAGYAYVAISASNKRLPFERRDLSAPGEMGAVVIAKFNPAGQPVVATRFGGPETTITAIAPDPSGSIIVTGSTTDRGFPLVRPIVTNCWRGGYGCTAPYVAKFDPTGSQVLYSTFMSGREGPATIKSMALDPAGSTYVIGTTRASDYPVLNAYQSAPGGGEDYILTKISPTGALESSTYLGGDANENAIGSVPWVLVDLSGRPIVFGATTSLKGIVANMEHPDVPLWRSADDGASWSASSAGLRTSAWTIVSERDGIWYLGSLDGVYRSIDGGTTWRRTIAGIPDAHQETFKLAVDPAHPGTVYAGTRGGTYKSENRGDTWTRVDEMTFYSGGYSPGAAALVVDGSGAVFLGTEGIRRSTDGGRTWTDVSRGLERGPTGRYGSVGSLVFDPHVAGTIYVLQSGRPYRSRDGGASWTRLPTAYPSGSTSSGIQDFDGLAISPGRPGRLYGSAWAGLLRSDNDGADWTMLAERRVTRAQFLFHPARAETMFAFNGWTTEPALLVSNDAGQTWASATVPRPGPQIFAVDPVQPGVLFALSSIRTLSLLVAFDPGVRRVVYSSFLDFAPPNAVDMDLAGAIYLIRTPSGRTELVKLQMP